MSVDWLVSLASKVKFFGDRYRPIIDRYMYLFGHKAKTNRCPTGMHRCMIDVHDRSNSHWPEYLRAWVSGRQPVQNGQKETHYKYIVMWLGCEDYLADEESLNPAAIPTDTLISGHWPTNATIGHNIEYRFAISSS